MDSNVSNILNGCQVSSASGNFVLPFPTGVYTVRTDETEPNYLSSKVFFINTPIE